jgi:D-beta-D-heptose 7-phosphate kinase / D-beta-D-heptose 1-phosphate adenosyltransferase
VVPVRLHGPLPEKTRFRAAGQTLLRVDSPAGSPGPAGADAAGAIAAAGALLVSDYGRGLTADPRLRDWLTARAAQVPLLWDPHPRGTEPVSGTRVVTPNHREAVAAAELAPVTQSRPLDSAVAAARLLLRRWPADAVAVTLGSHGVLLAQDGDPAPLVVPARPVAATDPCGAGDSFAATAASALRAGALTSEAVTAAAAAATGFLAAGGVTGLPRGSGTGDPQTRPRGGSGTGPEAQRLASDVRTAGGTVVATGGCFDVLHAGHVAMLRAARSLGDCLIVCLNSDASVRRLKGAGRPLNPAGDRAAVLAALACVDAVMIFEEGTPASALRRIRPHLWVKGGDYTGQDLPESAVLGDWGGHAVTVPYLAGRSTTRLHAAATAAPAPGGR